MFCSIGIDGVNIGFLMIGIFGVVKIVLMIIWFFWFVDFVGRCCMFFIGVIGGLFCMWYIGVYIKFVKFE